MIPVQRFSVSIMILNFTHMIITRLISITFVLVFLLPVFITAQTVNEDRIAFTTSDAPWLVSLNSKDLDIQDQQIKHDKKSGYFLLSNQKEGFTVSLFIEPAIKCKTSADCRDFVWKTDNPKWGKVQQVIQSKIGDVSYFEFFRPTVQGQSLQMQDMYAEFVEDGYWVDLHLSKVQYKKEDHLLFENFIKSIKFLPKNSKPTIDADKTVEAARKATEDWMVLWDSGKYKESYAELSSHTKKTVDEKTFSTYWMTVRKPFGKLKLRKILQIQLIKSLPGISDSSGAILRYLSSFEKQEDIFETFSLILEKDGVWRVAIYKTNE